MGGFFIWAIPSQPLCSRQALQGIRYHRYCSLYGANLAASQIMIHQPQPIHYQSPHFRNYWERGNGRELIAQSGYIPGISQFHKYSHLYHSVDELGDAAVADTYLTLPYPAASALVEKFAAKKIDATDNAPESLKKLFSAMQEIPSWYDPVLANLGAELCMRSGTNALIILRDFTLMGGYDFAYLNKPLILTGALKKGAVKRLKDTLEFWVLATRSGEMPVGSEAYKVMVRTRLMHSYARLSLQKKIPDWNYELWGQPINHWDMVATYTGFSLVFMQGLKKLGMKISQDEELGMYHLWKFIGSQIGIPAEVLPENSKEAVEQLYLWSALQGPGDSDSAKLSQALLDENLENTIYRHRFQRELLLDLHKSINWYLLDREVLQRLQIPKPRTGLTFPRLVKTANRVSQNIFRREKPAGWQKILTLGDRQQRQVLRDYIEHSPKDFTY